MTSVVAYADDVTIFLTSPTDITNLKEAIHCFEAASGARVNFQNSRAIVFGSWDISPEIMIIPYHDIAKILGLQIKNTVGNLPFLVGPRLPRKYEPRLKKLTAYLDEARPMESKSASKEEHTILCTT